MFSSVCEFFWPVKAFIRFKIGYTSIEIRNGTQRFVEDPSVEVFLLHAKADSSGLNLVNATHVILCEPLMNTALELQAIARVHRIGQLHPTTVWMYIVNGTVEETIYDISAKRRMAHMRSDVLAAADNPNGPGSSDNPMMEAEIEAANSLELQQAGSLKNLVAKGRSSGEIVDKADLWNCLFGNRRSGGNAGQVDQAVMLVDSPTAESHASLLAGSVVTNGVNGSDVNHEDNEGDLSMAGSGERNGYSDEDITMGNSPDITTIVNDEDEDEDGTEDDDGDDADEEML